MKILNIFKKTYFKLPDYKFSQDEFNVITLVQAAGIISVIIGHFYNQPFNYIHPYVFHMPLFFFLGGMLLSLKHGVLVKLKTTINKHGFYLIKSYVITGILSSLLVYFFNVEKRKPFSSGLFDTIEFTIKSNFGNNSLFVVGWFLLSYIIANIVSSLVMHLSRKTNFDAIIYASLALLFMFLGMKYLPSIYTDRTHFLINLSSQCCTAIGFMLLGCLSKPFIFKVLRLDIMLALLFMLPYLKDIGALKGVNIAWSKYDAGMMWGTISSLVAIYILFTSCSALSKIKGNSAFIDYLGKNTKSVMTYHLFSFFMVDIGMHYIVGYDITKSATYSHYNSAGSWPFYMLAGIIIPLMLCWLYEKIKSYIYNLLPETLKRRQLNHGR